MTTETVLERAKAMIEPPLNAGSFKKQLAKFDREIALCRQHLDGESEYQARCREMKKNLEKKVGGLFGIERAAIERLRKESEVDEYAIHNQYYPPMIDSMRKRAEILLRCSYPKMSPEPLRWRDSHGFPLLALFSLDDPRFQITTRGVLSLPEGIKEYYADVVGLLKSMEDQRSPVAGRPPERNERLGIEARFEGIIPPETRKKILPLVKDYILLKGSIYLLAEVEKWEVRLIKIRVDPLVIGCLRNGDLLLIDSFNVTPIEEYIEEYIARFAT